LIQLRQGAAQRYMTGSHAILYHCKVYNKCIDYLEDAVAISMYKHVDLILSNMMDGNQIQAPVPFLAEMDCSGGSDVRKDADLFQDKALLLETESKLLHLLEKLKQMKMEAFNK
jgi:hypothetical protein